MQSLDTLIEKARRNDQRAQGELLQRYVPFLTAYVSRRIAGLEQRVDSSDVVQEVHLKVCSGFSFLGATEAELTAWILTIADNTIVSLFRKHGAQVRDLTRERRMCDATGSASVSWYEPAGNATTPSQKLMKGEAALRLLQCIAELPSSQAEAIRLRHLDGLTTQQICEAMNRTPSAVAGLLQRGLQKLRQLMSGDSYQ